MERVERELERISEELMVTEVREEEGMRRRNDNFTCTCIFL